MAGTLKKHTTPKGSSDDTVGMRTPSTLVGPLPMTGRFIGRGWGIHQNIGMTHTTEDDTQGAAYGIKE